MSIYCRYCRVFSMVIHRLSWLIHVPWPFEEVKNSYLADGGPPAPKPPAVQAPKAKAPAKAAGRSSSSSRSPSSSPGQSRRA